MEPDYLSASPETPKPSLQSNIGEFLITLVVFLAIYLLIHAFIAQPHKVDGISMFPNFKHGDLIITDKITYKLSEPKRSDIVVFQNKDNADEDFIKRIMGVPGDKVKVQNNKVYVNGREVQEPYISVPTEPKRFLEEGKEITVRQGYYIVIGDNRTHSSDSREWGELPKDKIIGRVIVRYWPFNTFGIFPNKFDLSKY